MGLPQFSCIILIKWTHAMHTRTHAYKTKYECWWKTWRKTNIHVHLVILTIRFDFLFYCVFSFFRKICKQFRSIHGTQNRSLTDKRNMLWIVQFQQSKTRGCEFIRQPNQFFKHWMQNEYQWMVFVRDPEFTKNWTLRMYSIHVHLFENHLP